jgi:restriction system protein
MQPTGHWMVRAGEENELGELVEEKGAIAVGSRKVGDLSTLQTRQQFRERYHKAYPDLSGAVIAIKSGELYRFATKITEGEYIVTPLEAAKEVLIGLVDGPYEYRTDLFGKDYPHVRRARWLKRVPWDSFGAPARDAMGSALTVSRMDDFGAEIHELATSTGQA